MKSLSNIKRGGQKKQTPMIDLSQDFAIGKTQRNVLDKLLVICGRVGDENIATYEAKAKEIGADFIQEKKKS